jgi:hypothetical protein
LSRQGNNLRRKGYGGWLCGTLKTYGSNKAVSAARDSFNESGFFGMISERGTDLIDAEIDASNITWAIIFLSGVSDSRAVVM